MSFVLHLRRCQHCEGINLVEATLRKRWPVRRLKPCHTVTTLRSESCGDCNGDHIWSTCKESMQTGEEKKIYMIWQNCLANTSMHDSLRNSHNILHKRSVQSSLQLTLPTYPGFAPKRTCQFSSFSSSELVRSIQVK